jgi:hypothetical protein
MTQIKTHSPIKAWTLATFAGCRVSCVHRRPRFGIGRYTFYQTSWVLVPAGVCLTIGSSH